MKISDLVPQLPPLLQKQVELDRLLGTYQLLKSSSSDDGTAYRMPSLGLDTIQNSFIREQRSYRWQIVKDLQQMARSVEEIRSPIGHIIAEVFRRGIQWESKFAVKCRICNTEYSENISACTVCYPEESDDMSQEQKDRAIHELVKPDNSQKEVMDLFFMDSNCFDQSLEQVLRQFFWDALTVDDAFLYIVKEYIEGPDGSVRSKPIEIRRLDPGQIQFDLDNEGLPKNSHWVCYLHRTNVMDIQGVCTECGKNLVPAMYQYWHRGSLIYLIDSEVVHISPFMGSETYGYSPILTVYLKAMTLIGMDSNLHRYFWERRMPASIVMVFTDDPEGLRREREAIAARMRQDPNYIPMVAVSTKQNRGRVDHVKLFHTLQEMDYLPVRSEIRERIAAIWGVTPVWQGVPDSFGGLSQQTQQLTVMSRVVENHQRMFHEKVFPLLLESFGITDWLLKMPNPEEKAESTRITFAQQRVNIASALHQLGFNIEIKSSKVGLDNIDFIVSGETLPKQQGGQMGALGGLGGSEGQSPVLGIPEQEKNGGMYGSEDSTGLRLMQKSSNIDRKNPNIFFGKNRK